ncbi:MAG: asparagine synthase-related protein [Trueperaceae bacterium]
MALSTALRPGEQTGPFAGEWLVTLDDGASAPAEDRGCLAIAASGGSVLSLRFQPGQRPEVAAEHGSAVVFEGTIYNRQEIIAAADVGRDAPQNNADLVLAAHLTWGEQTVRRLKGTFAFCLWDGRRSRLLAARDRVGVFPLFYSRQDDVLQFATSLKAFERASGPGLAVDRALAAGLLARHHPGLEETFYRGLRRVPPGSLLVADGTSLRVERYWRPPPVGAGAEWVDESELGEFGRLLDQSVGRALRQGPAGIYLSGGLDSVSVAAAAVEHSRGNGTPGPRALSLLFPGEVSEEETQRRVADSLGIPITTMDLVSVVGEKGLVQTALDFSVGGSAPPQNVWLPAYHQLALEGKRHGCRTILTGGGGDEWLTVTPLLAADLLASLDLPGLVRFAAALQRSLRLPSLPLWRNIVWSNGLRPLAKSRQRQLLEALAPTLQERRLENGIAERLSRIPAWLAPDASLRERLEQRIEERARARSARPSRPGVGGHYFAQMEHSLQHPLFALDVEEIFDSGRRLGMRQFDIYWDADLIEFLYRVPPHLLNRGGRSKGLVREDLERRFPGFGFDRQKKLLSRDFFAETLFDQSAAAWRELGGAPALADLGIIEPRGLDRFIAEVVSSRDKRHIDDLWRILSLESWVRPRV